MGLETTTYISGLTPSWPVASDLKSQGDDHIRLIKSVLVNTFPNATKAFSFPSAASVAGPASLALTSDQNGVVVYCTTTGGVATVTLPTLTASDGGWSAEVVKYSTDTVTTGGGGTVLITPASGTIMTQFGALASVRLGSPCSAIKFWWTGAAWMASRDGPMIGSTTDFDGSTTPAGWFQLDGSAFNAAFTELAAAVGTTILRDKRGRSDVGIGTGTGLTLKSLGVNYGNQSITIGTTNLPAYTPVGTLSGGTFSTGGAITAASTFSATIGAGVPVPNGTAATPGYSVLPTFNGTPQGGASTPLDNYHPSIGANKIIRAC